MANKIYVTEPSLPELEEFIPYLEKIWQSKRLTNNGQFHQQLEQEMAEFLGVKYVSLFTNGTLALVIALRVLKITGEVITTPYSFVATTHALWWNDIVPVFVDIDPKTYNIDPEKIEASITKKTSAILPVHVYGIPCDTKAISELSEKNNLKVIYDAAHAFGVEKEGTSVLNYGDLSILSFHATKSFNTIEGGAIICHDAKTKKQIDYLKNFGFENETTVVGPGINAKMNELQSAFGLLQLKSFDREIRKRKKIADTYDELLINKKGIHVNKIDNKFKYNYSYYPVLITEDYPLTRNELYFKLRRKNIYCRRYFFH